MFHHHAPIDPAPVSPILVAAEDAARAIPPAFPLSATVAVNPFLGQTGEDLATAAARLARVGGTRLTRSRADYRQAFVDGRLTQDDLAAALDAQSSPLKPASLQALLQSLDAESPAPRALPTVAELAAGAGGTDWPAVMARSFGLWAAGYFDRGQALWTPAPGRSAYAAWREWASHDLTPEIVGLASFCAHVGDAPDTPERAILRAADSLGLTEVAAPTVFHRLLLDLGGWAQHARWLLWQAELTGATDSRLTDLLAIRLIWEEALFAQLPGLAPAWAETLAAHTAPVAANAAQVVDAILQDAAERAHQRTLITRLSNGKTLETRPLLQAAFCIDVRSEVIRRALEIQDPGIATLGFAGFFGLPVAHRPLGSVEAEAHLPVLLSPSLRSASQASAAKENATQITARATRAWGRFRQAAVSSFAFVESAGALYGWKLLRDSLPLAAAKTPPNPAPQLDPALSAETKAATAAAVLRAMSLTQGHARLVLLVGHGAELTNNPHGSAYHCGACGGHTGEVSARLLATLLNDPETRAGLAAHGLALPEDTFFVAGLHDTASDTVNLFEDGTMHGHAADLARAKAWLSDAGALARAERAARLPGARAQTIAQRATNWAQVRPEWGLAGCAAFIAAPRSVTADADLAGRAFLHSYDWRADQGFATLELILTAPVVVASWISLQYYGSSVAPEVFGGGNKLIHNVVGGIGVVEGNGGVLRAGLPWQTVHDGTRPAHDPLRLSVFIDAPQEAISAVLSRHEAVRALFDNSWLHLLRLDEGRVTARYRPGLQWEETVEEATREAA